MEQEQVNEQKQPPFLIYAVVIIAILAAVVWLVLIPEQKETEQPKPITPVVEAQPRVEILPEIEPQVTDDDFSSEDSTNANTRNDAYIMDDTVTQVTVTKPVLDDAWLMTKLVELVPNTVLVDLIVSQDLISNFVVFVDNASRGELVTQFSPLVAPQEKFSAQQVEGDLLTYQLDTSNFQRYDVYASLLSTLPLEQSLEIYKELTPAIDEAHMELGYEAGTFNRKLKRALEFLIDAPVLTADSKLVAPSAMYQFADPELEGLLSVQKLLLRMGPENQQKVRSKLVEFRDKL